MLRVLQEAAEELTPKKRKLAATLISFQRDGMESASWLAWRRFLREIKASFSNMNCFASCLPDKLTRKSS